MRIFGDTFDMLSPRPKARMARRKIAGKERMERGAPWCGSQDQLFQSFFIPFSQSM
jgi:hypothetical protein